MNIARQLFKAPAIGVAIVDDAASLSTFRDPACPAAIWRRQTPPRVQSWIDRQYPDTFPSGRITLRPDAVKQTIGHLCDMSGLPLGPERDWLETDITSLAEVFAVLMSAEFLRMRLAVVTTNACRKFHIDAITARLICTYRGTGTQYGIAANGADPERVFTVQTGAPILLRGTQWPVQPPKGLLHRSPPIEGTGEARLVLVLDPVLDTDEDI